MALKAIPEDREQGAPASIPWLLSLKLTASPAQRREKA